MRQAPPSVVATSELLPQVVRIAHEAGAAIMDIYSAMPATGHQIIRKEDGSPLTQADLAAHQVIARALARLTPDIPVVSEEDSASQAHRQPRGRFWLVDPLDGTKEFLARNGEFTVNIALVQDGVAVLGVVVAPALGLAYWGAADLGAFRQSRRGTEAIRVASGQERSGCPLRVLASKSHMNAETQDFLRRLGPHELIQSGSSLKFCRLAEGSADLYPRLGSTCEWDTAAGQAVLEAAGGRVSQLDGAPLRYGKPDVVNPHFIATTVPQ
ncbi:MAG: 3'(2'),5'-bisphosphate nucleotidase [Curvibacter sp. GWA2_64_110]|nr:MAG: 3'(2'),5'-bisphosphate nucleotidase [Curvibacter sp. GWA2_64_110]HCY14473.1 3'(2'),5'-bisphosphate nucleotidase [Curvibacter sp.]